MLKKNSLIGLLVLSLVTGASANPLQPSFYVGFTGGGGSTTWSGLVPVGEKRNGLILISTPTRVDEGGIVLGVYGGYEFTPYFAIEGTYLHYPRAEINFSQDSLFTFIHDGQTSFQSQTDTLGLVAKISLTIPYTPFRIYSATGVARIQRNDELLKGPCISPTFGIGLMADLMRHLTAQIGFTYTAGYGESEIEPTNTYIPFLYAGFFGLAYRFC